ELVDDDQLLDRHAVQRRDRVERVALTHGIAHQVAAWDTQLVPGDNHVGVFYVVVEAQQCRHVGPVVARDAVERLAVGDRIETGGGRGRDRGDDQYRPGDQRRADQFAPAVRFRWLRGGILSGAAHSRGGWPGCHEEPLLSTGRGASSSECTYTRSVHAISLVTRWQGVGAELDPRRRKGEGAMSETALLYMDDSYLREFEAVVLDVTAEGDVILDQTAFYPTGGGQPNDTGRLIAGDLAWDVVDVRKRGATVLHRIAGDGAPEVGQQVRGEIDWDRRYKLMRTHTALHVLCGVIFKEY